MTGRWRSTPDLRCVDNKGNALSALGRKEEAIACYDRALEIEPRYAHAWNNKGIALSALGRKEEAIACYDRALEIDPRMRLRGATRAMRCRTWGARKRNSPA